MDNSKSREKLFSEFPAVSTEKWEEIIQIDLKGADYEKKLAWKTLEGLKVRPYYRREHLEDKKYLDTLPGEFPYVRGNKTNSNDWEMRQDIQVNNIETANHKALFILDRGITAVGFRIGSEKGNTLLKSQSDFSLLLKDIYFECIGLHFIGGDNAPEILNMLSKEVEIKKIDPAQITGSVDFDPLGYLAMRGKFAVSETADLQVLSELLKFAEEKLPSYRVITVNGYFLHNSGASIAQELGYSLALANEYMAHLTEKGFSADAVAKHLQFNFGVGTTYFMEIAKIRAARLLWAKIVEAYKPAKKESCRASIHSFTSEWNQTIYDPYVNILRGTTEAMAAVIGGTDSLAVRPFDFAYKTTSKFSGRLARNIQIILKEESYLNRTVDPGAGSYYIENLTDSIIDAAWKIFLKVEEEGGYLEALKKGTIQADIEATAKNRDNMVATRREIYLGTNQYANPLESVTNQIEDCIAFKSSTAVAIDVKPIISHRGTQEFEKLRLATEKHAGGRPKVFMLTLGNLTMRKARAAFSCNFFACAGYELLDNLGFKTPEAGVKAAQEAKADIVVVCSSDEEYVENVPAVSNLLGNKAILVVAGAPACIDELKAKGIENFVHIKSNVLETLQDYHKKLGISL